MSDKTSTPGMSLELSKPQVFISHRHSDAEIANVLRVFIRDRSGGRVDVFQSSAPGEGPRIGRELNEELIVNLRKASLVILIYTTADQDWSYCMWECGAATSRRTKSRTVVFQCGRDIPSLFAAQVRVDVRSFNSIQNFVNEFLTSPNFFPLYGQSIAPGFHPNDSSVQEATQNLYDKLQSVIPPVDPPTVEEWFPYPFLTLELRQEQVETITRATQEKRLSATEDVLRQAVVSNSDKEAARVFGMPNIPPTTSFATLLDNWSDVYPSIEPSWLEALARQVMVAARGQFPTLVWEIMRGCDRNDGTWYAPVLNRVRIIKASNVTQFDVYFNKFELDEDRSCVKVGVPRELGFPE